MATALIVDNSPENLLNLAEIFRKNDFSAETCQDLREAREILIKKMPEVALFNEQIDGRCVFDMLEQLDLADIVEIYLMSEARDINNASRAMRLGISDYFDIPVDNDRLAANLQRLREEFQATRDDDTVSKSARGLLIGESPPMQRLYRLIRKCAPSTASILIIGESGAGKELVARTIHELSNRASDSMLSVNCSAIPSELMESELFGHRKGSFTGATKNHRGFFERASGGTLFLDEITEMDVALQAKFLRVLEVNSVRPIGSEKNIDVDVRIITATNQDPAEAIAKGKLREDLYYRLAEFPIHVPALRDKAEDIPVLAQHFLDVENEKSSVAKTFAEGVTDVLLLHDWPGNVRELKNAIVHGHLLAGETITEDDLPDGIPSNSPRTGQFVRVSVGTPLVEVERRHILSTLAHFDGDKKQAADALGISLKTLYNRLNKYGAN
ncbi:MAG: sigma-54 dependent transcriptional regulator [Woeseiaceae bacterium]|nr:sigma-54 dependent transcriptional regulator [Woeseiaceae bacterium]